MTIPKRLKTRNPIRTKKPWGKAITSYALLFVSLSIALFTPSSVHAASVYDDIVSPTDQLLVQSGADLFIVTDTWYDEAVDKCTGFATAYDDMIANDGAIAVSNYHVTTTIGGAIYSGVQITLKWGGSLDLTWTDYPSATPPYGTVTVPSFTEAYEFYASSGTLGCYEPGGSNTIIAMSEAYASPTQTQVTQPFFSTFNANYPSDYEGELIPATAGVSIDLKPEYTWSVKKDELDNGILNVAYMNNLPFSIGGTTYLNVSLMTSDWAAIDEDLGTVDTNPAFAANMNFNIGPDAGYFMFRVDNESPQSSPPAPDDATYNVSQVYYQFYWDGVSTITGNTVGCAIGTVCNPTKVAENQNNTLLNSLNIESFGLADIVTAPLAFFASLPTEADNCDPLQFPLMGTELELPCMRPIYEENLGEIFTIWQTVLVGGFSYYMGLKMFHRIKQISNPKDDSIEVVHL